MWPIAANLEIFIFGGHLEFRRHFDSIEAILQLVTIHHWIRHTSKPLYTNFYDLYTKATSTSLFDKISKIIPCLLPPGKVTDHNNRGTS